MNDENQQLMTKDDAPLVVQPVSDSGSMLAMIGQMATNKDVDIDKVERLMKLQVEMQERENEAAFNSALSAAQAEIGVVTKNKYNEQTNSNYADLGAIVKDITPVYTDHGINLSFDSGKAEDELIPMICYVSACGHTRPYHYDSPITDKGLKGAAIMTQAHARGSAISYGRRYLTCMIFNIATADDDGNQATVEAVEVITPDQTATIHSMLEEKGAQEGKLLTWYNFKAKTNINSIKDIAVSYYGSVVKGIEGFHDENN